MIAHQAHNLKVSALWAFCTLPKSPGLRHLLRRQPPKGSNPAPVPKVYDSRPRVCRAFLRFGAASPLVGRLREAVVGS
jgi:hypothetical protein